MKNIQTKTYFSFFFSFWAFAWQVLIYPVGEKISNRVNQNRPGKLVGF
ncbi:MAG: hypothetical protein V1768_00590 [Patescibacteria group bacterium]|nr:hypothetical protein [Patescibacteria group bacterium]MBU1349879.1 hypothetical protein [Patescibacteria group bacterium]MBU1421217.1 hypothetical protein [Patescibacteria group bacterium]MBU1684077.1 hypothetical protein [Patescibacteria group bacterium]MBU1987333.1 hypothetical protein [Patescibacteria group bacterium]